MPRAYSLDLRERTVAARDAGLSPSETERLFRIDERTQRRWRQRAAADTLAPGCSSGRPPKIGPEQHGAIRAQIAAYPDATLAEHCTRWEATTGVRVSSSTMSRLLTALGLPLKKRV
jgi:putative transposase